MMMHVRIGEFSGSRSRTVLERERKKKRKNILFISYDNVNNGKEKGGKK